MLSYLLRHTFFKIIENEIYLTIILVSIAFILAWLIPWIQILHFNVFLMILCVLSLGNGLYSIINTKTNEIYRSAEYGLHLALYDQIRFIETPNVYYIVPDSYPNRAALQEIYDIDNSVFYEDLELLGFKTYHHAFSNYMYTGTSVTSLFSMRHHFYQGSIGNFEMLNAREFIAGKNNPTVDIFKNNGYEVNYIHQNNSMFTRGCYVDLCSPSVFWGDFIDIFVPDKLKSIRLSTRSHIGLTHTVDALVPRFLEHVDMISTHPQPHFVYVHMATPNHSSKKQTTVNRLASFRKKFFKKIHVANDIITKFVQHILTTDPNALIIINADHGAWGFGTYRWARKKVFEGVPDDLIALDYLGVLLAIRWPYGAPKHDQDLQTNVNLFRHIFAYLSESEDILATKVPDHGYIIKGRGNRSIVAKAIDDGEILKHMVEIDTLK
jgi:hypothetical protein